MSSKLARRPGRSSSASALFWNSTMTWNSGWCDRERTGLSTSTKRSNGTSWWA